VKINIPIRVGSFFNAVELPEGYDDPRIMLLDDEYLIVANPNQRPLTINRRTGEVKPIIPEIMDRRDVRFMDIFPSGYDTA
jgi:hypothetical protein